MSKIYFWDEPFLYNKCGDQLLRRCVYHSEVRHILTSCHNAPYEGNFGGVRTSAKVLKSGYLWPSLFKDAHEFVKSRDRCQRIGNVS